MAGYYRDRLCIYKFLLFYLKWVGWGYSTKIGRRTMFIASIGDEKCNCLIGPWKVKFLCLVRGLDIYIIG